MTAAAAAVTVGTLLVTEHPDEVDEDRDGERADGNRDGISAFGNAAPVAVRPAIVVLLLFLGGKEAGRLGGVVEDGDDEVLSSNTFDVFPTAVAGGCLSEAGVTSGCALKYREQDRRFTPCKAKPGVRVELGRGARGGRGGGGGRKCTYSVLALVVWPLTTVFLRDGALKGRRRCTHDVTVAAVRSGEFPAAFQLFNTRA